MLYCVLYSEASFGLFFPHSEKVMKNQMFEIGSYVVYGNTGICKVENVVMKTAPTGDGEKQYYELLPVFSKGSKAYLPVDNTKVVIRDVISKEDALTLIDEIPQIDSLWISSDKEREEKYKALLKECSCRSWVCILKTVYNRKQERLAIGKKVTATDERYSRMAEENLYNEIGFVLGVERDRVESFITERIMQVSDVV